jgi:phosphatidylserine decarboxylase
VFPLFKVSKVSKVFKISIYESFFMSIRTSIQRVLAQEDLNFLLTNRLPRNWLTQAMGRFSKIEHPWVRDASIALWRLFTDLDLSEAKQTHFKSLHDCFTRELKPGMRPVDATVDVITSPSDGILGAHGRIENGQLFQAKGFGYRLDELLGDEAASCEWHNGSFVTIRLTSAMYHRFHAPHDCQVERVTYFSGDTWNVNPIALKRVEKLFCKNERAFLKTRLRGNSDAAGQVIAIVPVAAILVASIRLHFLNVLLHLKYRGPNTVACHAEFAKGQEMGWFQHGSTIIVLMPPGFALCEGVLEGASLHMGQPLMRWVGAPASES